MGAALLDTLRGWRQERFREREQLLGVGLWESIEMGVLGYLPAQRVVVPGEGLEPSRSVRTRGFKIID